MPSEDALRLIAEALNRMATAQERTADALVALAEIVEEDVRREDDKNSDTPRW